MEKVKKVLGNSVSKRILMFLFNNKSERLNYAQIISRKIDSSLSSAMMRVTVLSEIGLINITKKGRINKIKLTNKGREIAEHLTKIEDILNGQ